MDVLMTKTNDQDIVIFCWYYANRQKQLRTASAKSFPSHVFCT